MCYKKKSDIVTLGLPVDDILDKFIQRFSTSLLGGLCTGKSVLVSHFLQHV